MTTQGNNEKICSVADCSKPLKCKNLCSMHVERLRVHGDIHFKPRRYEDLTGRRFGQLTVIKHDPSYKITVWICRCDCGVRSAVQRANLVSGHTTSCGCKLRKTSAARQYKHGMTGTPTYRTWVAMRRRCHNPAYPEWHLYGGRGITVCQSWRESFEAFFKDMGERPEGRTIDRIDVDKGYAPGNCRWATPIEQANNKRPK